MIAAVKNFIMSLAVHSGFIILASFSLASFVISASFVVSPRPIPPRVSDEFFLPIFSEFFHEFFF